MLHWTFFPVWKKNISGEGIAKFYDAKEGKMFTEPVYFFQRDFFALYGEDEILGWVSIFCCWFTIIFSRKPKWRKSNNFIDNEFERMWSRSYRLYLCMFLYSELQFNGYLGRIHLYRKHVSHVCFRPAENWWPMERYLQVTLKRN